MQPLRRRAQQGPFVLAFSHEARIGICVSVENSHGSGCRSLVCIGLTAADELQRAGWLCYADQYGLPCMRQVIAKRIMGPNGMHAIGGDSSDHNA